MQLVEGSHKVEQVFGRWPTFHDAEVLSITLDRKACGTNRGPTIRFTVHAFEMTAEVDARGYYVRRNHVLVTFALYAAAVVQLQDFGIQNVLSSLHFSRPAQPIESDLTVEVALAGIYGVHATFQCARAEVVAVEPYDPEK